MRKTRISKNDASVALGKTEQDVIRRTNDSKIKQRKNVDSMPDPATEDIESVPSQESENVAENPVVASIPSFGSDNVSDNNQSASPPRPGEIAISQEELKAIIQAAVLQESRQYQQKLDSVQQQIVQLEQEKDQIASEKEAVREQFESQLKAEKDKATTIQRLLHDFDYDVPIVSSDRTPYIAPQKVFSPKEIKREFDSIWTNTEKTRVVSAQLGKAFLQYDSRAMRQFIRQYGVRSRDNYAPLYDAMETEAKKEGLLQGRIAYNSDAVTDFTSLSPILKTYLSEMMRLEHSPRYVLWQIPNRTIAQGIPPRQTVAIPRIKDLASGVTASDWELDPTTPLTAVYQGLEGSEELAIMKELGLGAGVARVHIPEFVMATSLIDLIKVLQQKLGKNYDEFVEISILEKLLTTTAVRYNDNGVPTAAIADLAEGDGGQLTTRFLNNLYADMASEKIPPFPDGRYMLFTHPRGIAQLNSDLQSGKQYLNLNQTQEVVNMLYAKTNNEDIQGNVTGYVGEFGNFHIFAGNYYSTGAPATPGVQTETIDGEAQVTRSSFAIGADTLGWATAMPAQIRQDKNDDSGRAGIFTWISHETGAVPLDVDPDADSPDTDNQDLRVFEIRTTDKEIVGGP